MSSNPSASSYSLPVVLIADDEPAVLEVVRAMARSLGWRTLLADNGAQALAALREHAGTIDRVLMDLHMPRVDGRSVLEIIRTEHPGTHVVVMTGDCDARESGLVPEECELLAKPFEFAQLNSALHREWLAREVA